MNKDKPDYPKTIEDAEEMIQGFIEETTENSDWDRGYRNGLRVALTVIKNLKSNLKGGSGE